MKISWEEFGELTQQQTYNLILELQGKIEQLEEELTISYQNPSNDDE